MFEKLIANLKQSLPEPLRKKLGMEDNNHDEESEEYSEEQSEESHDTSDNESEASANDKKKKQISMLIRVVAVIALGYMAITEFVLKPDDNEVPTVAIKPRRPHKKVPRVAPPEVKTADASKAAEAAKPAEVAEVKPAEVAEVKPAEASPEKPAETKPIENQAPVENINIADKKTEEPQTAKSEDKPIEESSSVKTPTTELTSQVGEVKTPETQVDKSLDSLIDNVDKTEKSGEGISQKKDTKMEDKIVADDVYTPPPTYDQLGRGLVYNCKEKYWACVDKIAYVACNKNMKWNQAHGKTTECAIQNVYNSDDDCGVVQKYNVSTNKPTTFCK